jgi:hypothetical protein
MTGIGRHRRIADAPSLTALAHPTRLALIEAIGLSGTLTATQASTIVGESPTACAYHLRTLASVGFIEEAGGGRGRERPWRLSQDGMSFDRDDDDPTVALAAKALSKAMLEHWVARIRSFDLRRSQLAPDVRDATGTLQTVVFATPAEFAQLRADMLALMRRYGDRTDPADAPPGSYPFEIVAFSHLLELAAKEADDASAAEDP